MKAFVRNCRALLLWLAGLAVFFAVYFPLRGCKAAMNWLCSRVILPLEQWLGGLCGVTSVSVAEVLILSGLCAALFYLAWQVRCLIARPRKRLRVCRVLLTVLCALLSVYAGFCLMWGVFYGADSFQDKSGLTARGGTAEELTTLTRQYAEELSALSDQVARDENGCFAVSRRDIFAFAPHAYDGLVQEFD